MEHYTEEFLKYVMEIKKNNHPLTIPCLDVLFLIFTSEQEQDEKTTLKKSKK